MGVPIVLRSFEFRDHCIPPEAAVAKRSVSYNFVDTEQLPPGLEIEGLINNPDSWENGLQLYQGSYLKVPNRFGNKSGNSLNEFSLILDVFFVQLPERYQAIYQTNETNSNDAEAYVIRTGGFGVSGEYGGQVKRGDLTRLVVTRDLDGNVCHYVNGSLASTLTRTPKDGRWSIDNHFYLFASNDPTDMGAPPRLHKFHFTNYAFTAQEVKDFSEPALRPELNFPNDNQVEEMKQDDDEVEPGFIPGMVRQASLHVEQFDAERNVFDV
eukprot:TRINITY_DN5923_c0_g1_i10.p1 TRINITY_DN5923_c0_g1~~TRINITY_DN5923_c0_g1_i10.p1  ORF type:complete len:304 (+),score=118.58 TRINITY_DN5923_c0_g1_i10:109-912(+)